MQEKRFIIRAVSKTFRAAVKCIAALKIWTVESKIIYIGRSDFQYKRVVNSLGFNESEEVGRTIADD